MNYEITILDVKELKLLIDCFWSAIEKTNEEITEYEQTNNSVKCNMLKARLEYLEAKHLAACNILKAWEDYFNISLN